MFCEDSIYRRSLFAKWIRKRYQKLCYYYYSHQAPVLFAFCDKRYFGLCCLEVISNVVYWNLVNCELLHCPFLKLLFFVCIVLPGGTKTLLATVILERCQRFHNVV